MLKRLLNKVSFIKNLQESYIIEKVNNCQKYYECSVFYGSVSDLIEEITMIVENLEKDSIYMLEFVIKDNELKMYFNDDSDELIITISHDNIVQR